MRASIYLSSLEPFNKSEIIHTCEEIVDTWCKLSHSTQDVGTHRVFEIRCNKRGFNNVFRVLNEMFINNSEDLIKSFTSILGCSLDEAIEVVDGDDTTLKDISDFHYLCIPEIGLVNIIYDSDMDKEKEEYDVIIDFKEFKEIK